MKKIACGLAALVAAFAGSGANALAMGDTVTCAGTTFTCGASSATVGAGPEFTISQPVAFVSTPAFRADFSDGLLTLTSLLNVTNLGTYVLRFTDTTNPITSASLLGTTGVTVGFSASDVTVAGGALAIDLSNTIVLPGNSYSIGVAQAAGSPSSAVPETATWAMMLAGFAVIGAALRRRPTARARLA